MFRRDFRGYQLIKMLMGEIYKGEHAGPLCFRTAILWGGGRGRERDRETLRGHGSVLPAPH